MPSGLITMVISLSKNHVLSVFGQLSKLIFILRYWSLFPCLLPSLQNFCYSPPPIFQPTQFTLIYSYRKCFGNWSIYSPVMSDKVFFCLFFLTNLICLISNTHSWIEVHFLRCLVYEIASKAYRWSRDSNLIILPPFPLSFYLHLVKLQDFPLMVSFRSLRSMFVVYIDNEEIAGYYYFRFSKEIKSVTACLWQK